MSWTQPCLLLGHSGFNWWFSLLRNFNGVVSQPRGHTTLFLSSFYLCPIIGLIRDSFVTYVDSLMENLHADQMF